MDGEEEEEEEGEGEAPWGVGGGIRALKKILPGVGVPGLACEKKTVALFS